MRVRGEFCHLIGCKTGRAGAERRAAARPMAMKYSVSDEALGQW